jgi:formylglycine-generating enzyme required for sulfatase activity
MLALLALAVDFQAQVRPVLESACVACHGPERALGNLRVDSPEGIRRTAASMIRRVQLAPGEAGAMPPGGPPLKPEQVAALKAWIAEGAPWPAGVSLGAKKPRRKDDASVTSELRARMAAAPPSPPRPYRQTIPGSDVAYDMVPIPAGEFDMGTPESEPGRRKDEGPVHRVRVEAMWMQKHEVTWDAYRLFMFADNQVDPLLDAVSRPTRPYVEMSFGMGINGYPAISMTHHAANKYAQWLSAKTGQFHRLPTEAEWEYACRAGTRTAYSFGDDASKLGEFAVFGDNSNGKYEMVGKKKPNAWGLHDMHGNVMEWTLDQYVPDFYPKPGWAKSTKPYPHSARGGSWNDDAEKCRCGARAASDASWKMQDPQLPKSIWYHTDAQWLGFRLVRPARVPSAAEMHAYWNNGVESE